MRRLAAIALRVGSGTVVVALAAPACMAADWVGERSSRRDAWPVYQRRALEWSHGDSGRPHGHGYMRSPPVSAGWFQRPYPYHLDYYRMRYGGSYAPYFGNLYGPPQVVTAPPYYGPYYGGYGYPNGYALEGGNGMPLETADPSNAGSVPITSP